MAAMWVLAICHAILTACVVAVSVIRLMDEIRFRQALDGLEGHPVKVRPKKADRKKRDDALKGRRKRANEWLNDVKKSVEKAQKGGGSEA